ncbi:MAG: 4'-phosphopantetheinyl transferase superfamily protein [bacterium]|nr:4'-phosphopantetheinyl transferase superfamily protein [bacterium]
MMKLEVHAVKLNFDKKMNSFSLSKLMNRVDPMKASKLRRFVREEDLIRGLFGDLMIRDLIRQKTGLANHQIEFDSNEYGKPALRNRQDFHFNISHSGDWVVAAIDENPVGIDIEEIQHIDLSISRDYFSPDEHKDLMTSHDRQAYFFTLWSLKESYIKILGKGLSHPLNAFSIRFTGEEKIAINVNEKTLEDVFFTQYNVDKNYKMGLCATHNHLPLNVNILTMEQLSERFNASYGTGRSRYQAPARQFHSSYPVTSNA